MVRPAVQRSPSDRQPGLQPRHQENDADPQQQQRGDAAEDARIQADGEADRGNEQADGHERSGETGCKRCWPEPVLGDGSAEYERQQR